MRIVTQQFLQIFALALGLASATPAMAVDPLYESDFERLVSIIGSLYFLDPLCNSEDRYWRYQAQELIYLDQPDDDRKERLMGAFNDGYGAYSRTYRTCTGAARIALDKLLDEADQLTQTIHSQYSE